jgi:hypothetical protein
MQPGVARVIGAGVLGTLVMTMVGVFVAPMMGMPAMNPAEMLAGPMGGSIALGWAGHLMIGTILAFVYAWVAAPRLAGPVAVRGAVFSLAPWLMAQLLVMPMMGMGLFSSSMVMAGGSLVGHLVYGAVVGAVTGAPGAARSAEGRLGGATAR